MSDCRKCANFEWCKEHEECGLFKPNTVSILIKGMSKKDFEEILKYARYGANNCMIGERAEVVELPPHGRLIDADAFLAEQRHLYCENCARRKGMKNGKMKFVYDIGDAPCRACGYGDVLDDIEDAPTIIEAEGEE